jgi:putative tributyrin esterase
MAVLEVNVMSSTLMRKTTFLAILPVDDLRFPGMPKKEEKPLKTLYLLHGIFGNYSDWLQGTRIERFATENNIAVIMPSGDNSFYVDNEARNDFYGRFIGEELVALTRKMFPLSKKREDTFIGGLSMGGYGAIRNGLKYSETFGAIVGLSSGLITYLAPESTNDAPVFFRQRSYYESIFGDLTKLLTSDKHPEQLILNLSKEGKEIPRMYIACGTEDDLLDLGRRFKDFAIKNGADVTYEEGPGAHEWNFWDTYIEKGIKWLLK